MIPRALRLTLFPYTTLFRSVEDDTDKGELTELEGEADEMYDEAVRVVVEIGKASTSTLQRRLRLGYGRAARLIDMMERSEEHTSELQSLRHLVCRLLLEKKK